MARTYAVPFSATAITAAQDLFEVVPADDNPVRLLGMVIGQYTDVGDAASENLSILVRRLPATFTTGTGCTQALTPVPLDVNDAAAGFTADTNNTGVATTNGTAVVLWADVWNTQAGYQVWWPEGAQPQAAQAAGLVVTITAPADSITTNGVLYVQEL